MRIFYDDEGPIDTLLQIAEGPVWDGNLVSKQCRDKLVNRGWVARCCGYNILTPDGNAVITTLRLKRMQLVTPPGRPYSLGESNEGLQAQAQAGMGNLGRRPTIDELEAILQNPNPPNVRIRPDGTVEEGFNQCP